MSYSSEMALTRKVRMMNTITSHRLVTIACVHGAAITIAIVAALGSAPAARGVVAANHCTRYAPVISQDNNCTVRGTLYSTGTYSTPSTALRDSNEMSIAATRTFELAYYGGNGAYTTVTGTYGSLGSSGGYAYSKCWLWNGQSSVSGRCTTYWHN